MAIQFRCSSCSKPIEVDDDWANQPVSCPFCGAENVAPLHSTLQWQQQEYVRSTPGLPTPGPVQYAPATTPYAAVAEGVPLRPNRLGNWSLGLSILSLATIALAIGSVLLLALSSLDLRKFQKMHSARPGSQGQTMKEMQQELLKDMQAKGYMQWLFLASAVNMAAIAVAVLALALGIAGITRRAMRKGTSVAGLIISGGIVLCSCCMFVVGLGVSPL